MVLTNPTRFHLMRTSLYHNSSMTRTCSVRGSHAKGYRQCWLKLFSLKACGYGMYI